jgi:hypothetical protein
MFLRNCFVMLVDDILNQVVHLADSVGKSIGEVDLIILPFKVVFKGKLIVLLASGWPLAIVCS